jgi:hypothetical protein
MGLMRLSHLLAQFVIVMTMSGHNPEDKRGPSLVGVIGL